MNAIEVKNIGKKYRLEHERRMLAKDFFKLFKRGSRYEQFWALRNINFSVKKGETLGIIGENGVGKSTLLRILAGVTQPTEGEVKLEGRIASLLELGAGFHTELTGRENIYINASILGLNKREIDKRFDMIAEFADIGDFINTPIKAYSSGMQLRLGFAIAVNVDPDILLIDEVLAVGDAYFRRRCYEKINELKRAGKTILFVSHSFSLIESFCHKCLWIKNGSISKYGEPTETIACFQKSITEKLRTDKIKRRYGSGEIVITDIEIFDKDGVKRCNFNINEKMIIKIKYFAKEEIKENIYVGIAFHRIDGFCICTDNTISIRPLKSELSRSNEVAYDIENLLLQVGSYYLTVAIFNDSYSHYYDCWERSILFNMQKGNARLSSGISPVMGRWELT